MAGGKESASDRMAGGAEGGAAVADTGSREDSRVGPTSQDLVSLASCGSSGDWHSRVTGLQGLMVSMTSILDSVAA